MTEQELDAWGADGMDGLNALWSAMDELEPVLNAATARAEAAEQRAEALAAELEQARADRALMTGRYLATVGEEYVAGVLMPAGLDHDEAMATYLVQGDAYDAPDTEVVAVIRRALGGAA